MKYFELDQVLLFTFWSMIDGVWFAVLWNVTRTPTFKVWKITFNTESHNSSSVMEILSENKTKVIEQAIIFMWSLIKYQLQQ